MSTAIVVVNAQQVQAPTPDLLQEQGAIISQGATTLGAGNYTLVANLAGITAIAAAALPISGIAWAGNVANITTTNPHGWTTGQSVDIVVSGAAPAGYNGAFVGSVTTASNVTYPLNPSPGSGTGPGTVALADESELIAQGTTYFAYNGPNAVYVLELGEGNVSTGVAALSTFIAAQPLQLFYSYMVPREWDNNAAFLAFARTLTAVDAMTYFFVTTTVANRAVYAGIKSVIPAVEAPGIPATEFSIASEWAVTLAWNPSSTNQIGPLTYAYVYGVTAYPLTGNAALFIELQTANCGWVAAGQEGGVPSSLIVKYGKTGDGKVFNYWYSADWAQININQALANEVINGVNSQPPLIFNQQGIDRLQNRAAQTCAQGIGYGLAIGQVLKTKLAAADFYANVVNNLYNGFIVINAEPFTVYTAENPNDYAIGRYAGFACAWTPAQGFQQIVFDLNVIDFA